MTAPTTTDPGSTDPGPVPAPTRIDSLSDATDALTDIQRRRVLYFLAGYAPDAVSVAVDWITRTTDTPKGTS